MAPEIAYPNDRPSEKEVHKHVGSRRRCSLVFVTRNELAGLRETFSKVPIDCADEVIAVDASSTDGTQEFFREHGIRVHVQRERGLGAAMLEARAEISGDALIYFHPDGNEDPSDIPKVVERLRLGADFVVASRMIPGAWNEEDANVLRWRKWANQGLALIANALFARNGVRSTDITNGFRGIACEAFDRMCLTSKDLTMDFQMIIRALKLGMFIDEFPTREGNRVGGETNFPSIQTGLKEVGLIWRELLAGQAVFRQPAKTLKSGSLP
jgi:glycosyltransferase involved in cell wall biosynthesis